MRVVGDIRVVAAACWVLGHGVGLGVVGRLEVGDGGYEAVAAQAAFGGLVHVQAGCG